MGISYPPQWYNKINLHIDTAVYYYNTVTKKNRLFVGNYTELNQTILF